MADICHHGTTGKNFKNNSCMIQMNKFNLKRDTPHNSLKGGYFSVVREMGDETCHFRSKFYVPLLNAPF